MPTPLNFSYPDVLQLFMRQLKSGRSESRAFLEWFLENYYRLEDTAAQDAICDGPDDKGVDAIYVDDTVGRVDVFQSRLVQNQARTLGDTQLKEFVGTLAQFQDPALVTAIENTTSNKELAALIADKEVAAKVGKGYVVRGVFLTNTRRDANAESYLATQSHLELFDEIQLQQAYIDADIKTPVRKEVAFDVFGYEVPEYKIGGITIVIAPLAASDLVKLEGIQSGELFAWNVRAALGQTNVNKDIMASIAEPDEHKHFLLYHNGLTVLCESVKVSRTAERVPEKVVVSGYTVVNGCQSLTSLYEQRARVTPELRILTRAIQVQPNSELALKITHHSNNQNGIKPRDLQSNNPLQVRLQAEFEQKYGGQIFFRVKRGQQTSAPITIENEQAARCLLAFDLHEPWLCHQTYRLFDDLHARIFGRPEVTADRIVAIMDIYNSVVSALDGVENTLLGRYGLTSFFLLSLIRDILESDPLGKRFCRAPVDVVHNARDRTILGVCVEKIAQDLVLDLNAEVKERAEKGEPLDYKRELKSATGARALGRSLTSAYQKLVSRGRVPSFSQEWAQTEAKLAKEQAAGSP